MPNLTVYRSVNSPAGEDFYNLYLNSKDNQGAFEDGIPFAELAILKNEEFFYLYGILNYAKNPKFIVKESKKDDVIVNDKNLPICIPIRYKEGKNWKQETETPSSIEKKLSEILEEEQLHSSNLEEAKNLKCFSCKLVADSTNAKTISEDSGFFHYEFLEEKKELPDLPIDKVFRTSNGNNGNSFNGAKRSYTPPPTAYEKASNKLKFILEGLPPEWEIKSLSELAVLSNEEVGESLNGTALKDVQDKATKIKVVKSTINLATILFSDDKAK